MKTNSINPFAREDAVEKRLHEAINANDTEVIAYFARFGKDVRQQIMNVHRYEQAVACGYKEAPKFDEYGWLKEPSREAEEEVLIDDNHWQAKLMILQHPNGRWVCGRVYQTPLSGCYSTPGIWSKWYDSREEAKRASLKQIISHFECIKGAEKKHLKTLRRALGELSFVQLSFDF